MNEVHHIGRVVKKISKEFKYYRSLGFECVKPIKIDSFQKVKVGLVNLGQGIFLELLEPYGEKSPIKNFLTKGGGLHHICYKSKDLESTIKKLKELGTVLSKPTPSIFSGKKVFFFYSRQGEILEFIEDAKKLNKNHDKIKK